MFKIYNARNQLWQWDIGQRLIVSDELACSEVHFCNGTSDCALVCEVYEEDGLKLVDIPNILLQEAKTIKVFAYVCNGEEKHTQYAAMFPVFKRTKPDDYVYTETEVLTWKSLDKRIDALSDEINNKDSASDIPNVFPWAVADLPFTEDEISDVYSGGGFVVNPTNYADGKTYFRYHAGATSFKWTNPNPQVGSLTITLRGYSQYSDTLSTAVIVGYSDGTEYYIRLTHGETVTYTTDASKTVSYIRGNYDFENWVLLDMDVLSIVADYAAPASAEDVEQLSEEIADKADKTLTSADGDSWEIAVESDGDVVSHKTAGTVEIVAESLESATFADKILTLTGITATYGAVIIPDASEISIDVPANVAVNPYFADPNGWQYPSFGWFFLRTSDGYIAVHTTNHAEVYTVSADLKTWTSIGGATTNVAEETMRVVLNNGTATVYSDDVVTYTVDGISGIGYGGSSVKAMTVYGVTVIHRQSGADGTVKTVNGVEPDESGNVEVSEIYVLADGETIDDAPEWANVVYDPANEAGGSDSSSGSGTEEWVQLMVVTTEAETAEVIFDAGEEKRLKKVFVGVHTGSAGMSGASAICVNVSATDYFETTVKTAGTGNTYFYPTFKIDYTLPGIYEAYATNGGYKGDTSAPVTMAGIGYRLENLSVADSFRYCRVAPYTSGVTFNAGVKIVIWGVYA